MPHHPLSLSALLIATLTAWPLAAEPVQLVSDLDAAADPALGGSPEPLVVFDDALYFWNDDPLTGTELWKSDGTPAGTVLLKDVCPGRCGSRPPLSEAAVAGGRLFFNACDGARGCQLWTSDGSARGTQLVAAFGSAGEPFLVRHFTAWNDVLYFGVAAALYRTDGSPEGTALVRDLSPGAENAGLAGIVAAEDRLFVSTLDELWTSDGTAAGTERILELPIHSFVGSFGTLQTAIGGRLFFTTPGSPLGDAVWTSDGTAAGTLKLRDAGGRLSGFLPVAGKVLFFDNMDGGVELWTTDGTAAGTTRLRRGLSSHAEPLAILDGELYFANLSTLWRSDGTAAGTRVAHQFPDAVVDLRVAGEALYVLTWSLGETAVWRTLATAGTSERVLGGAAGHFEEMFAFGDRLALPVAREGEGEELALLEPQTGDLAFLTDVADPGSGDPGSLAGDKGRLLFAASGGVHSTRGTAASTELVAAFSPDARLVRAKGGSFVFDGGLWFLDAAGVPVLLLAGSDRTRLDADLAVAKEDELFFLVLEDFERYELWRSDGTSAGTAVAATGIPPNHFCWDPPCTPVSIEIKTFENEIFIVHQTMLLRLDLRRGNMATVFDAGELESCSGPSGFCEVENLTVAGDRLFFTSYSFESFVLWTSDGSAAGTRPVRELLATPVYHPAPIGELAALDDRLFFVFPDPELGVELWTSDGTAAGTAVVSDLRPGPRSSFPRGLTAFDGRLVFAADDGVAGHELWASDGTAEGTSRVADVCPGRCSSLPRAFAAVDGVLLFAADDGVAGAEPWRSDLTAEGTWRIGDVSPGPAPSDPREFTRAGRRVYFNAATPATGFELFAVERAALDEPPAACAGCLVGGRFQVRVDWVDPRGVRGTGRPVVHDDHNVFFWFFGPDNLELLVKVLDGGAINGHYWVFYGALSDVEYTITVEDLQEGTVRTYHNPAGNLCGQGDVRAFPSGGGTGALRTPAPAAKQGACAADDRTLCLNDGRFRVEVDWTDPAGVRGAGHAVPLTGATGAFWFFGRRNLELVVKLLDGSTINGRFWFFYGGLSDVEYTIAVTDTKTGARRVYRNAAGELCGRGDTSAFY